LWTGSFDSFSGDWFWQQSSSYYYQGEDEEDQMNSFSSLGLKLIDFVGYSILVDESQKNIARLRYQLELIELDCVFKLNGSIFAWKQLHIS